MSKVLRTAAIVVGVAALVATGIGAAAGAGLLGATASAAAAGSAAAGASAIGGFLAAASTVAGVASVAAGVLSVGAQLTAQAPPLQGSALTFAAAIDAGIPYLVGRTATRGSIVYRRSHSTPGYALPDLQTFGVILGGGGPYRSIESFSADTAGISFTGAGDAIGSYATWMWQQQQLGLAPESAALKISTAKGYPPGWGVGSKLSGFCAAMWTLRFDTKGKFYGAGLPKPLWVVEGAFVYDPRQDSTYPGGSGACRAGNEATYVWSENPWLHTLTFALGRYQNGRRVLGAGYPVVGIDVAAFVEAANVADANGWTIGGMVMSTDDKWVVMQNMAQAGGGAVIHLGARLSCVVNAPRITLATVTAADVVGEASAAGTRSRRGRFNTVIPKYRSEDHGWEIIAGSAVTVASHVTEDGGERRRELTWPLVQDLTQAEQLARYAIENGREFEPVTLPLKLRWMGYRPGDCIAADLPEIGLNGQPMIIIGRSIDPASGVVTLTLRSETFAKHAFALGQTGTAPPLPSLSGPPVPPQPAVLEWSITGNGLVAGDSVTPALIVEGGTALPIAAVVFEYRRYDAGAGAEDNWVTAGIQPAGTTRAEITALLPGTGYEVGISYRLGGFTGPRRVLGPTSTAGAGVAWFSVSGAGKPEDNATNNPLGDFLNKNGSFQALLNADGSIPGWSLPGYAGSAGVTPGGGNSTRGLFLGFINGQAALFSDLFAVTGNERNWTRVRFGVNTGPAYVDAILRVFNAAGTYTDLPIVGASFAAGSFYATGEVFNTIPAGSIVGQLIFGVDLPGAAIVTGNSVLIDYFETSGNQFGADQTAPVLAARGIEDNADQTSANIANGFIGAGLLAYQDTVDYATQITGLPPAFGAITLPLGQSVRKFLNAGQSVVVDGYFGATGATGSTGNRQSTLTANGTVFATGADWYAGPGEPGGDVVSGTYTHSGASALVAFAVSYSGAAVVPDDNCFVRA